MEDRHKPLGITGQIQEEEKKTIPTVLLRKANILVQVLENFLLYGISDQRLMLFAFVKPEILYFILVVTNKKNGLIKLKDKYLDQCCV